MADTATEFTPEQQEEVKAIRAQHSFLGHPKGIGTLSFMQLCNSFASYGMSSILIYYLYTAVADGGLGLPEADAQQLISLYSSCSILAGLVGSYVADRVLGPRKALGLSRLVQAIAYVVLALPFFGIYGYAASQFLLIFGAMLAGRSLDALTGMMYENGDGRRDAAFVITYVISNIGAAVPAITGTVSLIAGYSVAFSLGAILAVLGFVCYVLTQKFFGPIGMEPDDPLPAEKKNPFIVGLVAIVAVVVAALAYLFMSGTLTVNAFANFMSTAAIFIPIVYIAYIVASKKSNPDEKKHVLWLIPLFITNVADMTVWTCSTTVLATYADTTIDRVLFGMEFSPAVFQTLPAVLAVVFGSILTARWTALGKRQPSSAAKIGLGTILWGCGPLFMTLPFILFAPGVKVSPLWLVMFYVLIILGEGFTSGTGYAAANTVAPKAFATQMMTVWSLSQSTGAGFATLSVNFYTPGNEIPYFLVIGGVTAIIGLLTVVFSKKIARGMGVTAETAE